MIWKIQLNMKHGLLGHVFLCDKFFQVDPISIKTSNLNPPQRCLAATWSDVIWCCVVGD